MKKTFPITLLLVAFELMTSGLCAQSHATFTVIKVSGSVYSSSLKRAVKNGDVITLSDKLKFDSRESYMHVINPQEGLKTVRNIPDNSPREFMQLLQTFLNAEKKHEASRGGDSGLEKIKHQLSYDTLLILGEGRMVFDSDPVSLKKPAGIKASYLLNDLQVEHVISDETGFNLGKEFLIYQKLKGPYPKVNLTYYEDMNDAYYAPFEILGNFVPMFAQEELLAQELKAIITTLKAGKLHAAEIDKEILAYLSTEYAKPIEQNVKDWLEERKLTIY